MLTIELKRTGDFWVDTGLITFWNYFADKYYDQLTKDVNSETIQIGNVKLILSLDNLIVEGEDKQISDLFNESINWLKQETWKKTQKGKMKWAGPAAYFFKHYSKTRIDTLFKIPSFQKSKKRTKKIIDEKCELCGRDDSKLDKAGSSEIMLSVTAANFQSFHSLLKKDVLICKYCRFLSHFAPLGSFYKISDNVIDLIFFEIQDLLTYSKFRWDISRLFAEKTDWNNYKSELNVKEPLEMFLDFLHSVWKLSSKQEVTIWSDKKFHIFSAESQTQGISIRSYYIIPEVTKLVNFFSKLVWIDSNGKLQDTFVDVLKQFIYPPPKGAKQKKWDTTPREELSRAIVFFAPIELIVENFLYQRCIVRKESLTQYDSFNFRKFLETYEMEVMKMDEKVLNNARSLGNMLGKLSVETEDKGILYTLRNVSSLQNLLDAIHQLLTRHIDKVVPYRKGIDEILQDLNETNWEQYRSLIGIYAVLEFLHSNKSSTQTETKEEGK